MTLCLGLPRGRQGKIRGASDTWGRLSPHEKRSDVASAIGTLSALGNGFKIVEIGGKTMVQSVPTELSTDHMDLLNSMAASGHITAVQAEAQLGWTAVRTDAAMEMLLERGLVWIDDQAAGGARTYWSHGLSAVDADLRPASTML